MLLPEVVLLDEIIKYIKTKYNPISIIVYGSYASGTNNLNSDFDAIVISYDYERFHDTSFVDGVELDVFVYPLSYFERGYEHKDFIQILDGIIITDSNGIGEKLQEDVKDYFSKITVKTDNEIRASIDWCVKMFERVKRNDCEGMFRWHWVLIDSLEIFCDIMNQPYLGPKKSLKWMKEKHPLAFNYYKKALESFDIESLKGWITYIKKLNYKE